MACASCEWGRTHMGGCLTCMKFNALVLDARARGLDHWTRADLPEFLKQISGETYYCKGLKTFRAHAQNVVLRELGQKPNHGPTEEFNQEPANG